MRRCEICSASEAGPKRTFTVTREVQRQLSPKEIMDPRLLQTAKRTRTEISMEVGVCRNCEAQLRGLCGNGVPPERAVEVLQSRQQSSRPAPTKKYKVLKLN
jgi:hypothetical protein